MKKFFSYFAMSLVLAVAMPVFTSCSDDKDDNKEEVNLNKAEYERVLTECEQYLAAATQEDYPQAAIEDFRNAIATAKEAFAACKTQSALDAVVKQLETARDKFLASAYGAIPPTSVIALWKFDQEGNEQVSEGTYHWTAVAQSAPAIFGTNARPEFVDGVKGGKAVYLAEGAHLTVSDFSQSAVLPTDFTINVWVKTSRTYPNNYIISYNFWNTWKLQVQDQNKPFFTFAGNDGICDADNELDQSVAEGEWTMITAVLSYTAHTLSFYINGELTKVWDAEAKPALASTGWKTDLDAFAGFPIFIGLSTSEEIATKMWDWTWDANSLGAFYGAIDNLGLYNVALGEGQVKKLYKEQK